MAYKDMILSLKNDPHEWIFSTKKSLKTCWEVGKLARDDDFISWDNHLGIFKNLEIRLDNLKIKIGIVSKRKLIKLIKYVMRDKMISFAGFKDEESANRILASRLESNPASFRRLENIVLDDKEYQRIICRATIITWRAKEAFICFPGNIVVKGNKKLRKGLKEFEKHVPGTIFCQK